MLKNVQNDIIPNIIHSISTKHCCNYDSKFNLFKKINALHIERSSHFVELKLNKEELDELK